MLPVTKRLLLDFAHSIEVPLQMQHGIARKGIGYGLVSSLRIDGDIGIGELMKKVEHLQTRGELLLQERAGNRGIPHKVIGVEVA